MSLSVEDTRDELWQVIEALQVVIAAMKNDNEDYSPASSVTMVMDRLHAIHDGLLVTARPAPVVANKRAKRKAVSK